MRVGGHERDAVGAANRSEAQRSMVEREREHAAEFGVRTNPRAAEVEELPVGLPGR